MGLDGTLYDQVLDTIFYLGLAPERFSVSHSQASVISTLPMKLGLPHTPLMLEAWRQALHTIFIHLLILCRVMGVIHLPCNLMRCCVVHFLHNFRASAVWHACGLQHSLHTTQERKHVSAVNRMCAPAEPEGL